MKLVPFLTLPPWAHDYLTAMSPFIVIGTVICVMYLTGHL